MVPQVLVVRSLQSNIKCNSSRKDSLSTSITWIIEEVYPIVTFSIAWICCQHLQVHILVVKSKLLDDTNNKLFTINKNFSKVEITWLQSNWCLSHHSLSLGQSNMCTCLGLQGRKSPGMIWRIGHLFSYKILRQIRFFIPSSTNSLQRSLICTVWCLGGSASPCSSCTWGQDSKCNSRREVRSFRPGTCVIFLQLLICTFWSLDGSTSDGKSCNLGHSTKFKSWREVRFCTLVKDKR